MTALILRLCSSLDTYLSRSRTAPWDAYLANARDPIDLERRLNQLERGETRHVGL
jgi:hypothetical protein